MFQLTFKISKPKIENIFTQNHTQILTDVCLYFSFKVTTKCCNVKEFTLGVIEVVGIEMKTVFMYKT